MKDASATGDGIKKIQDVADLRAWCGKLLTICRIHLVETKAKKNSFEMRSPVLSTMYKSWFDILFIKMTMISCKPRNFHSKILVNNKIKILRK